MSARNNSRHNLRSNRRRTSTKSEPVLLSERRVNVRAARLATFEGRRREIALKIDEKRGGGENEQRSVIVEYDRES